MLACFAFLFFLCPHFERRTINMHLDCHLPVRYVPYSRSPVSQCILLVRNKTLCLRLRK